MRPRTIMLLIVGGVALASRSSAAPDRAAALDDMTIADHVNLERNLRWVLERERASKGSSVAARVAVFADAGVWHVSARSVVHALEQEGVACRVLDGPALADGLAGVSALVLPGGWGSFQAASTTEAGRAAIRSFVEHGGRVLGICAGAFLLSKTVAWSGKTFDYGLGLFDGTAEGPLAAVVSWPQRGAVRLRVTPDGEKRGLSALAGRDVLYYGGPRLLAGTGAVVLASYPDGTPAAVSRRVGDGEVVLIGPHVERPAPPDGGDDAAAPALAGPLLRSLLRMSK